MKAVLLSIKPKYCELIANGKKTAEIRRDYPKVNTPFRCYIYCSKSNLFYFTPDSIKGNGKVIGEFVCDSIIQIQYNKNGYGLDDAAINGVIAKSCVPENELYHYLQGKTPYLWHISDLVMYDKPKELGEFIPYCYRLYGTRDICDGICDCEYQRIDRNPDDSINAFVCTNRLRRPPQNWCYVEELEV